MTKMKNIYSVIPTAILTFAIMLSACGTQAPTAESPTSSEIIVTPTPEPTESASPSEDPSEILIKQFKEQALANPPANELFASLKQMMEQMQPPAQADELIRILESYYEGNLPEISKQFEATNVQEELAALEWPIQEDSLQSIKDSSVRELAERTLKGGYKLTTAEGFIFPIVDYSKLLSFNDQLSIQMKTYLDVMATESDTPSASDGGLIITWDELSSRTLAAESYVVTFPDAPERDNVEEQFIHYLSMYLIGLNNTPIFDYDTFKLLPDVKSQYEQMVASHAGTVTGQLTKELLSLLNDSKDAVFLKGDSGEQVDIPANRQFREQLETKARSLLPIGKK